MGKGVRQQRGKIMEYKPLTAVWEVTMGCNMRCGHCGSSCEDKLPGELTTDEAFKLIDQIAELGLRWITISGGEPLMRRDLPQLVGRLHSKSVDVNIITNGWLLSEDMAASLKKSGVSTVAVSIDGTRRTHDKIRKEGSFERIQEAVRNSKAAGITVGAVTTVSNENLDELNELHNALVDMGFDSWQLQIGLPMGNFKERPEWILRPEQIEDVIDFCYKTAMKRKLKVYPADCIGYYTEKEVQIRQLYGMSDQWSLWNGCNAGVRGFGILHNGDILGCTSIRDKQYIEGNVKEIPLTEIWNNPDGFKWRRTLTKDKLGGGCALCTYGSKCLGGCPNTRLTMNGDIYSENQYCAYNVAMKRLAGEAANKNDAAELVAGAEQYLRAGNFQAAAMYAKKADDLSPDNREILALRGFAEFMCGNYALSEAVNRKILEVDHDNAYALKGLGLARHRQGYSDEGLAYLQKAAKLTNYQDRDIMEDMAIVMRELSTAR